MFINELLFGHNLMKRFYKLFLNNLFFFGTGYGFGKPIGVSSFDNGN
jgi:hypothetical protein